MSNKTRKKRHADPARQPVPAPRVLMPLVALSLIVVAVLVVYGRGLSAPFVYDDPETIIGNSSINHLWPLFGPDVGGGPLRPPLEIPTSGRPLVNLSFALNYHFGQLETYGYHVVNFMIHVASAMVLFALVRRTLELPYFGGRFNSAAGVLASAIAVVWAVHPLQIDAVQYITQRTELLVGFFYLSTLYASLRYFESPPGGRERRVWLFAAVTACLCGMASKEVMVTAPLVVLLFDRTFLGGSFLQALKRSPALYGGLCASWALLFLLHFGGSRSNTAGFGLELSPLIWWATQCKVLILYGALFVWPSPLLICREFPYLNTFASAALWVVGAVLVVAAAIYLVFRRKAAGFVAAASLLVLSPTLIVPIVTEVMAERRMYLPSAAFVALSIAGGYSLAQAAVSRREKAKQFAATIVLSFLLALTGVVTIAYCVAGAAVVDRFNDPVKLWGYAVEHQSAAPVSHHNYGILLIAVNPQEALKHFEEAVRLQPKYPEAFEHLGVLLAVVGRKAEAIEQLRKAIALDEAHSAKTNIALGALFNAEKREKEAIPCFETALRLQPDSANAHSHWAVALMQLEQFDEAITHFEKAVELQPSPQALANLALAYARVGRDAEAVQMAEKASQLARAEKQPDVERQIELWLDQHREKMRGR